MRTIAIAALMIASVAWGQEFVEKFGLTIGSAVGIHYQDRQVIVARRGHQFNGKQIPGDGPDAPEFCIPVLPDMILTRELWRDPATPGVEQPGAASYVPGPTFPKGLRDGSREEQMERSRIHYEFWKQQGCPVPPVMPHAEVLARDARAWLNRKLDKQIKAFRKSN